MRNSVELKTEQVSQNGQPENYGRIVFLLAWPAIVLNVLQTINSLLDAKFVGGLGKDALSASGAAMQITFMLISLAMALGSGTTALVSRFYGSSESSNMIRASRQSTSLSLVLGIILTLIAWFLVPHLAPLFVGDDQRVLSELLNYVYPILVGIPAVFIFNTVASSLRAIGDTKKPMYVSGAQIVLHILLNYLLMYPPHQVHFFGMPMQIPGANLGIAGAGWAFTISAWFAVLVYFPVAGRSILGQVWKLQLLSLNWVRRILKIAGPAALQSLIRVLSLMVFAAVLKFTPEGTDALGAMRVGFSMEAIAFMPAFGYMIAASTLVGQSLGMNNPYRAEKLTWAATRQGVLIMTAMSVVFLIFAPQIAGLFVEDPGQKIIAENYLRIIAVTEPLFGYAMILTGAFQGAGDTMRPLWITVFSLWIIRAPLAWIFVFGLGGNSNSAWWVMSLSQGIQGILMIWLFKQGKWKEKKV